MHVLRHDKGFQCLNTYTSTKVFNQEADCLCRNTPVPVILIDAIVNANLKAVCSLHAFYPTACVSTHAVVLCDMNGRQMPLSPAPTSSSVPLGLIRRGYVSHRYIGPSVTP